MKSRLCQESQSYVVYPLQQCARDARYGVRRCKQVDDRPKSVHQFTVAVGSGLPPIERDPDTQGGRPLSNGRPTHRNRATVCLR